MTLVPIRIPQLGEGLQEARLVEFLKQPGDTIRRDEHIYVMETDKAVTEVESPYAGTLSEWLVAEDSVLEIGTEIGKMEVEAEVAETLESSPPTSHQKTDATERAESPQAPPVAAPGIAIPPRTIPPRTIPPRTIPPRTKRYLQEKGLLDTAAQIPAAGTKLMPEDVDRFLENSGTAKAAVSSDFEEATLPSAQQTLIFRMTRGAQVALPAALETELDWTNLAACREQTRPQQGPTSFAMFLGCVVQAMQKHSMLRSTLSSDGKVLRTYRHVNLGVAVSLPGDALQTAVVRQADTMDQATFFSQLTQQIEAVRAGADQIDEATTLTASNIGTAGMRKGIPLVVAPAVATLALGQIYEQPISTPDGLAFRKTACLTMSFDHRLLNGIGAANFLNDVRELVATYKLEGC